MLATKRHTRTSSGKSLGWGEVNLTLISGSTYVAQHNNTTMLVLYMKVWYTAMLNNCTHQWDLMEQLGKPPTTLLILVDGGKSSTEVGGVWIGVRERAGREVSIAVHVLTQESHLLHSLHIKVGVPCDAKYSQQYLIPFVQSEKFQQKLMEAEFFLYPTAPVLREPWPLWRLC